MRKNFGDGGIFDGIRRIEDDFGCGDLGLRKRWTTREKRRGWRSFKGLGREDLDGGQHRSVLDSDMSTKLVGRRRQGQDVDGWGPLGSERR